MGPSLSQETPPSQPRSPKFSLHFPTTNLVCSFRYLKASVRELRTTTFWASSSSLVCQADQVASQVLVDQEVLHTMMDQLLRRLTRLFLTNLFSCFAFRHHVTA